MRYNGDVQVFIFWEGEEVNSWEMSEVPGQTLVHCYDWADISKLWPTRVQQQTTILLYHQKSKKTWKM